MRTYVLLIGLLLGIGMTPNDSSADDDPANALANYVEKEDDSFGWVQRRRGTIGPTQYVELTLTSQTWRRMTWRHQLFLLQPSGGQHDTNSAVLYIGGGAWRDELAEPPGEEGLPSQLEVLATLAQKAGTPVAVLFQVPRQPIFGGLVEDEIISLTFEKFLDTKDPEWLLLLPMVKSAVRAMDAVQEYTAQSGRTPLKTFTVTGASKRGWTTWLTGAVDSRVAAIAPMVIDVVNMRPQMRHQLDAWGDYSYKIRDYTDRGLPQYLGTPEGDAIRAIVDPYSYRRQLTQPKLILLGTNDHYWPLDALNLYWDGLLGEKHVLYVPNNRHGLDDMERVIGTLAALARRTAAGECLPKLSWEFDDGAEEVGLRVESDTPPDEVRFWVATAAERDFRQSIWRSIPGRLVDEACLGAVPRPTSGYKALFGEAVFDRDKTPFYLSTNVKIIQAR